MEQNTWYDTFLEILQKKYPVKKQLVQVLMDLLQIERESVYRRLRKEVYFSIQEIVVIATEWHISLDDIARVNSGKILFQLHAINYQNPSKEDVEMVKKVIQIFHSLKNSPKAEYLDINNSLPVQFATGFEQISRFFLFKWRYQHGSEMDTVPFSKINLSADYLKLTQDYYLATKQVPTTDFIFDPKIFDYLVNDIRYFCSIYLITEEEKELIKKDIFDLLDYLQEVANKGYYPESRNKVNLYISQLKVETGYSYTITPDLHLCFVHVFDTFEIYSLNSEMLTNFITWMQLKKRESIQISEVDEKNRIDFFARQRQLVMNL